MFYLLFFPVLLWCVDFQLGIRVGLLFLVSVYFNSLLKIVFQQPRPLDLLPSVQLSYAEGFGFPSGHAQSSALVWFSIAFWIRKRIFWIIAFLITFLVGFSRIYLGVHFPHDVAGGWLAGGLIFYLYHFILIPRAEVAQKFTVDLKIKIFSVSLLPLILLIFPAVDSMVSVIGALTGVGWGLVINSHFIHFQGAFGNFQQRLFRFIVGVIGIVGIYFGLKVVFPQPDQFGYQFFRFIRYAILGLWIGAGAPWLFLKLRITGEVDY